MFRLWSTDDIILYCDMLLCNTICFTSFNTIYTRFARIRYDINSKASRKGHIVPRAYRIRKDISQIPLGIYIALEKPPFPRRTPICRPFVAIKPPFPSLCDKGVIPLCSFWHDHGRGLRLRWYMRQSGTIIKKKCEQFRLKSVSVCTLSTVYGREKGGLILSKVDLFLTRLRR